MEEENKIILLCKEFAKKADALETKGFSNPNYREKGFVADFNTLFHQYAYGKQNRTISGLNFRNPPRYAQIINAINTTIHQTSKTQYQVTFEGEPKFNSIRFIVAKKSGSLKLICFETFLGISKQSKMYGEEIWRKHKL